jgi:hypothetical protein
MKAINIEQIPKINRILGENELKITTNDKKKEKISLIIKKIILSNVIIIERDFCFSTLNQICLEHIGAHTSKNIEQIFKKER